MLEERNDCKHIKKVANPVDASSNKGANGAAIHAEPGKEHHIWSVLPFADITAALQILN